ncbi:TPA: hypothetical protein RZH67_001295, partial [Campylobacter coli]|nr:hypothetical protein [Campylobacter coli]
MEIKEAYFILGMHRSGTSALTGVLKLMGLDSGLGMMSPNKSNPKGYFENLKVYHLNEKILLNSKSSWCDPYFNIDNISYDKKKEYLAEMKSIIKQEFQKNKFVIKDPRNCLLFPLWRQACIDLNLKVKVIIPYRNPFEVAQSLYTRNNFSTEKSLVLWLTHFLFADFYSRDCERIFCNFNDLIGQTNKILNLFENFIKIQINENLKQAIINDFLEKSLKHHNLPLEYSKHKFPKYFLKILQCLEKCNFDGQLMDSIRKEFLNNINFFSCDQLHIKETIIRKQSKENKILNQVIQNRDETIVNQTTQINSLQTTLKDNEARLIQAQNLNNILNKTIQEKDIIINSNTNQIDQLQNNIQKNSVQINQLQSK